MPSDKPRPENLAPLILFLRGEKVLLDTDLAALYGVETRAINQAVKRNRGRFPEDFMFRLTQQEWKTLRSQSVIASGAAKERRSQIVIASPRNIGALPYAFTEQGVAMLSSVLRSPRAVEVNIAIMRTFVQLRRLMDSNRGLARKIEALEKKYDEQFAVVFDAIKKLITDDRAAKSPPKRRIGFIS
ncbi:MAG: ORF6N domain-containing protein [Betaproteobacteria bacterium]